jgi:hypothetical protein
LLRGSPISVSVARRCASSAFPASMLPRRTLLTLTPSLAPVEDTYDKGTSAWPCSDTKPAGAGADKTVAMSGTASLNVHRDMLDSVLGLCVAWAAWTLADEYLMEYTPQSELGVLLCCASIALARRLHRRRGPAGPRSRVLFSGGGASLSSDTCCCFEGIKHQQLSDAGPQALEGRPDLQLVRSPSPDCL